MVASALRGVRVAAASQSAMRRHAGEFDEAGDGEVLAERDGRLELGEPGDTAQEDRGEDDVEPGPVLAQVGAGDDEEDGDPQVDAAVEVGVAVAEQVGVVVGDLDVVGGALQAEGLEAAEGDVDGDEGADGAECEQREAQQLGARSRVGVGWLGIASLLVLM